MGRLWHLPLRKNSSFARERLYSLRSLLRSLTHGCLDRSVLPAVQLMISVWLHIPSKLWISVCKKKVNHSCMKKGISSSESALVSMLPNHCNRNEAASMTGKDLLRLQLSDEKHQPAPTRLSEELEVDFWSTHVVPIYFRAVSRICLSFHWVCNLWHFHKSFQALDLVTSWLCSAVRESSESGGHRLRDSKFWEPGNPAFAISSLAEHLPLYIFVHLPHLYFDDFLLVSTLAVIYSCSFQMFSILMRIEAAIESKVCFRVSSPDLFPFRFDNSNVCMVCHRF